MPSSARPRRSGLPPLKGSEAAARRGLCMSLSGAARQLPQRGEPRRATTGRPYVHRRKCDQIRRGGHCPPEGPICHRPLPRPSRISAVLPSSVSDLVKFRKNVPNVAFGTFSYHHYCSAYTEHILRSLPMRSNLTLPSISANRVSSLPMPTLLPGWICVPLWRTRMLPASTNCPSARLAPRRLDSESRPFEELETHFKHLLHLQNFDMIRIFVPQTAQRQHHAGEHRLCGVLILACRGKM